MDDGVEAAEAICRDLINKRDTLIARGSELDEDRRRIAFAAHTGDQEARKNLDKINQETAKHTSELASLDAAISESIGRLEIAKAVAALTADRENALALRTNLREFREKGVRLSQALAGVVSESNQLAEILTSINALGARNPSSRQLAVVGRIAILSALRQTPWARDFEPVAPGARTDFATLIDGWCAVIERDVRHRLGEEQDVAA